MEKGQSLVEVLAVLGITALVVTGLVIVVLTGMKNAAFAQNQSRATKYAQEALDQIKNIRDRDEDAISFQNTSQTACNCVNGTCKFSELFSCQLSGGSGSPCLTKYMNDPVGEKCYFKLNGGSTLSEPLSEQAIKEDLADGLQRTVIFEDTASVNDPAACNDYSKGKKITVKVSWSDAGGVHESNLQTCFSKLP